MVFINREIPPFKIASFMNSSKEDNSNSIPYFSLPTDIKRKP